MGVNIASKNARPTGSPREASTAPAAPVSSEESMNSVSQVPEDPFAGPWRTWVPIVDKDGRLKYVPEDELLSAVLGRIDDQEGPVLETPEPWNDYRSFGRNGFGHV